MICWYLLPIWSIINDQQFTCAKIKTREIIIDVIGLYIINNIVEELSERSVEKSAEFISILVDGSNHKAIKLSLIVFNNFLPDVSEKCKIHEFSNFSSKMSNYYFIFNNCKKLLMFLKHLTYQFNKYFRWWLYHLDRH